MKERNGIKWQEGQHVPISFTAAKLLGWLCCLVKPHPVDLVMGVLAIFRSYYPNSSLLIT